MRVTESISVAYENYFNGENNENVITIFFFFKENNALV